MDKERRQKQIDYLEQFAVSMLAYGFPNASVIHEPYYVDTKRGRSKPDLEFQFVEGIPVLLEITKGRLDYSDPKRRQRSVLRLHEKEKRRCSGEEIRSLVLYAQHFYDLEMMHAWIGILEQLADGSMRTNRARRKVNGLVAQMRIPDDFRVTRDHISSLESEYVSWG